MANADGIRAGRAAKRRKLAEDLSAVGAITELGQQQQVFAQHQQVTAALLPFPLLGLVQQWL